MVSFQEVPITIFTVFYIVGNPIIFFIFHYLDDFLSGCDMPLAVYYISVFDVHKMVDPRIWIRHKIPHPMAPTTRNTQQLLIAGNAVSYKLVLQRMINNSNIFTNIPIHRPSLFLHFVAQFCGFLKILASLFEKFLWLSKIPRNFFEYITIIRLLVGILMNTRPFIFSY